MSETLPELEHLVLLAVLRTEPKAYGVVIRREVADTGGRDTTRAAAYVALRRLEQKGLLRSRLGEPTAERGGRAKRFYEVTEQGVEALRARHATLARLTDGLEGRLGS